MSNTASNARIYPCPQCKKPVQWRTDNPFRPFCSERCKLIDFGDWAAENHRIPAEPADNEDSGDW
ncbi:MAG TPA: DNA gyrase inhibitor YacG [Alcanivoracaceae bacterium]|nr:DNA gyrase inhibitor YacG [Alcanivoracaceae bacterium]